MTKGLFNEFHCLNYHFHLHNNREARIDLSFRPKKGFDFRSKARQPLSAILWGRSHWGENTMNFDFSLWFLIHPTGGQTYKTTALQTLSQSIANELWFNWTFFFGFALKCYDFSFLMTQALLRTLATAASYERHVGDRTHITQTLSQYKVTDA